MFFLCSVSFVVRKRVEHSNLFPCTLWGFFVWMSDTSHFISSTIKSLWTNVWWNQYVHCQDLTHLGRSHRFWTIFFVSKEEQKTCRAHVLFMRLLINRLNACIDSDLNRRTYFWLDCAVAVAQHVTVFNPHFQNSEFVLLSRSVCRKLGRAHLCNEHCFDFFRHFSFRFNLF